MYKIHITGYAGAVKNDYQYFGSKPIDATVYAETVIEAIDKVERIYNEYISTEHRKVVVEECVKE